MSAQRLHVIVDVFLEVITEPPASHTRHRKLVLRRVVRTADGASVDEIRVGGHSRTRADLLQTVESLADGLVEVLRGREPGPEFPLRHADIATLDNLANTQLDRRVEPVIEYHGAVRDIAGEAVLARVDLTTSASTAAGRAAERVVAQAVVALGPHPDEPPRPAPDGAHGSDSGTTGLVDDRFAEAVVDVRRRLRVLDQIETGPARKLSPDEPEAWSDELATTLVSWRRPEAPDLISATTAPESSRVVLTFVEVDGLQIGRGNRQTNLFTYRLTPDIDLENVLRGPDVRAAMSAYATAPPDADIGKLRGDAVRALHRAARARPAQMPELPPPSRMGAPTTEIVEELGRTILIQDCRGVQIGDRARQVNEFAFTVSPTVDAADLLYRNSDLVNALVDDVCRTGESGGSSVHELLCAAIGARTREAYERVPGSGVVRATHDHVGPASGITHGPGARQKDSVSVAVQFGEKIHALAKERERVAAELRAYDAEVARRAAEWISSVEPAGRGASVDNTDVAQHVRERGSVHEMKVRGPSHLFRSW